MGAIAALADSYNAIQQAHFLNSSNGPTPLGHPVDEWEPRHFRVTGTCHKCGESIYAGQWRTREYYQYHAYRCPDAETNAVIRALAPEHDWINAPEPPTRN